MGERVRSREKNFNFQWFFLIVLLVVIITVTLIINLGKANDLAARISDSITIDNGDEKINWSRYATVDVELTESFNITKSGVYHLTGTLDDGSITIDVTKTDAVKLILDNVTIENNSGPAIKCLEGDDLVIELIGENYLEDGTNYSTDLDEDIEAVIYSKADLTFEGDGSLTITANYEDGIVSKDDLKFKSGTYNITAVDDTIRGKDSVYIANGDFELKSTGDAIHSSDYVNIADGNIKIISGDDGIHADRALIIDGGNIDIEKSYEGLEAQVVSINGGDISLVTSDDGINAGGGADSSSMNRPGANPFDADENCILTISGGNIYINAAGDGVDSNGYLYFNGGKVIIDGPTNDGNGALDSGVGIVMNGGEVIAVGASGMAENLGTNSKIYSVSIYFGNTKSAGTEIKIKDSSGQIILSHTSAKSFSHLAAGSEKFIPTGTYTIYIDGEEYEKFTISNNVTTVGNSYDIMKQRR